MLRQRLTFLNVEVIYRCQGHSAAGACPAPASIGAMYLEACVEDRFFDLFAVGAASQRAIVQIALQVAPAQSPANRLVPRPRASDSDAH